MSAEHVHDLPAPTPQDGLTHLVSVPHPLGTMDVAVHCYDVQHQPMGMAYAVAVDVGDVDVACLGGCARIVISTQPES